MVVRLVPHHHRSFILSLILRSMILVDERCLTLLPFKILAFSIFFPFILNIIKFQVWRRCSHKCTTGKKLMPPFLCFLLLFSNANISSFLVLSRLSFFLINFGFRSKFASMYNASVFDLVLCYSNIYLGCFRYFSLNFRIYHCKSLHFGHGIFITGFPNYGIICNIYHTWYMVTYYWAQWKKYHFMTINVFCGPDSIHLIFTFEVRWWCLFSCSFLD